MYVNAVGPLLINLCRYDLPNGTYCDVIQLSCALVLLFLAANDPYVLYPLRFLLPNSFQPTISLLCSIKTVETPFTSLFSEEGQILFYEKRMIIRDNIAVFWYTLCSDVWLIINEISLWVSLILGLYMLVFLHVPQMF